MRSEIDISPPELPTLNDTAAPLEMAENQRLLQWAIAQLPRAEANIFQLWSEEELDIQQIATILNVQSTSVSTALSKAKRKLLHLIQSRI